MGYTHYWKQEGWNKKDVDGWKAALPTIQEIIKKHSNIIECDDGMGTPPVADDRTINFNGIGDDSYETFSINSEGSSFKFCKTARRPYDQAVCEVLLVLSAFCPNFKFTSDGIGRDLDGTWPDAMEAVKEYGIVAEAQKMVELDESNGEYLTIVASREHEEA